LQAACDLAMSCCEQLAQWLPAASPPGKHVQQLALPLWQLAPQIYQLTALVLGSPSVCELLLTSCERTSAAEQVQQAAKQMSDHLVAFSGPCSDAAERDVSSVEDQAAAAGNATAIQAAIAALVPLAVQAAGYVAGGSSSNVPAPLRSFAVLNTAWGCLTKLAACASGSHGQLQLAPQLMHTVLSCALSQLLASVKQLQLGASDSRLRIVKFWMQCVVKLVGACSTAALDLAWQQLVDTTCALHLAVLNASRCGTWSVAVCAKAAGRAGGGGSIVTPRHAARCRPALLLNCA